MPAGGAFRSPTAAALKIRASGGAAPRAAGRTRSLSVARRQAGALAGAASPARAGPVLGLVERLPRLAARIPSAEFVELDSKNHILLENEPA